MRALVNGVITQKIEFDPFRGLTDAGWNLGDGIFESLLVLHGKPIALDRHLERMANGARELELPILDVAKVKLEITKLLSTGEIYERGRLRISLLSGGDVVMTYRELLPYAESATIKTYPFPKNERSVLAGKKSISYGENAHALRWAKNAGCDDALFLITQGFVSETAVANVMWQSGDSFFTPALTTGCLPGITREMVIEKFGVKEVEARPNELLNADALYLLSSTRLIQLVARYDDKNYVANAIGATLMVEFSRWIAENMN